MSRGPACRAKPMCATFWVTQHDFAFFVLEASTAHWAVLPDGHFLHQEETQPGYAIAGRTQLECRGKADCDG